jgi:hypothetical protein
MKAPFIPFSEKVLAIAGRNGFDHFEEVKSRFQRW